MEPIDEAARRPHANLLRESKDHIAIETIELCRELSIRAMLGGGPVLTSNGLMSPVVSRNASIVVDPASIRDLHAALRARGWRDLAPSGRPRILPPARLTLAHDDELAGLILYSVIPGFFADPEETFDLIWERHKVIQLRGQTVRVLGRVASAILASHDGLDGRASRQRSNFDYFVEQFRVLLDDHERTVVGDMVAKMGGCAEMGRLLKAIGVTPCAFTLPSSAYVQWRLRVKPTDVTDQLKRAIAFLELGPYGRAVLRQTNAKAPRSLANLAQTFRSLPGTLRSIFGAKRRWLGNAD
jgi:hypothetical protein